jgi:hypothetical protein
MMRPVVDKLTVEEMMAMAAYAASLDPVATVPAKR